jgi:hypothetical protein
MGTLWLIWSGRQPVLHMHAGLRTFEQDLAAHAEQYDDAPRLPKYRMST